MIRGEGGLIHFRFTSDISREGRAGFFYKENRHSETAVELVDGELLVPEGKSFDVEEFEISSTGSPFSARLQDGGEQIWEVALLPSQKVNRKARNGKPFLSFTRSLAFDVSCSMLDVAVEGKVRYKVNEVG